MLTRSILALCCFAAGCGDGPMPMMMTTNSLTVSAPFAGRAIPVKYAWDSACGAGAMNTSPPITVNGVPSAARSLALTMIDGDAFNFVHWLAWDLPTAGQIAEGAASMFQQGANDYGSQGYGGPCPPPGENHTYTFTVYALDTSTLGIAPGANAQQLQSAMMGKVLAQGAMSATYSTP
jgi:Raf kinase inhibitor-like YbhB/YbcL family protein